jgi:O-acetyl-ADP-ribose deacetylase (regulator of RNase III)
MGFTTDVIGYSRRPAPAKIDIQRRLVELVHDIMREMGIDLPETLRNGTGDGMAVFLPTRVDTRRAVPRLIRLTADLLAADNDRYRDRLRLRMAVVLGAVGPGANGLSGDTVVEAARMVDSQVLRDAAVTHPDADLVVLVSEPLFASVAGERLPGLDANDFRLVDVNAKNFSARSWLWTGTSIEPTARGAFPPRYVLSHPFHSRGTLGVIGGKIMRVRSVDIWVNSENTDMEMPRFNDFSVSSIIRYHGAVRDPSGHVVSDVVADELMARVARRRPVAPGSAFVTGSGALAETNNVRWIIHVAAVQGEPGEGFRQIRDVGVCVTNALAEADRLSRGDASIRSILFPLLGTGVAGGSVTTTATALVERAVDYLVATPDTRLCAIYFLGYTDVERATLEDVLAHHSSLRPVRRWDAEG